MSFLISILVLTLCSFLAVGLSARKSPIFAVVAAVLVSMSGINSYVSYKDALGVPMVVSWRELPQTLTVVFFRVNGEESITLWLEPDRLVVVPYEEDAEEALEGERESMGSGNPSTFSKEGSGSGEAGDGGSDEDSGESGNGEGEGEGEQGAGAGAGWPYELESRGGQVIPGDLPPKSSTDLRW